MITHDELIYSLNENDNTASIIKNKLKKSDIFIPRAIKHKDKEYVIVSINDGSFSFSNIIRTVRFDENSEVQLIQEKAFMISSIEEIFLPKSLKCINEDAFSSCRQLRLVEIPLNSSLQKIGQCAFQYSLLKSLTIPSNVSELEEGWCVNTPLLTNVILMPNNSYLMNLDNKFILGKSNPQSDEYDVLLFARRDIKDFIIPSFVKKIGIGSFADTLIDNIFIPSHITEINKSAFANCRNLINVDFAPDTKITKIQSGLFCRSSIRKINIPSHVTEICHFAFGECTNPFQVIFPSDSELQTICSSSFAESMIRSISIPSSVTKIGGEAFSECSELTTVNIPHDSKLQIIDDLAFASSSIEELFIPQNVSILGNEWCFCTLDLNKVKISPNNIYYKNYGENDEFVIGKSDTNSDEFDVLIFASRKLRTVTIPPFIKIIESASFCDSLIEKIFIPKQVKYIGKSAFSGCSMLHRVDIPLDSQLQVIKKSAFNDTSIDSLFIPLHIKHLSKSAFSECANLQIIEIDENIDVEKITKKEFPINHDEHYYIMIPHQLTHRFINPDKTQAHTKKIKFES